MAVSIMLTMNEILQLNYQEIRDPIVINKAEIQLA